MTHMLEITTMPSDGETTSRAHDFVDRKAEMEKNVVEMNRKL